MDIVKKLCEEFSITPKQADGTIKLIDEGNTIPFIARYRKEATGSLDDEILRNFDERLKYLRSLEERKEEIINHLTELEVITDELREKIAAAQILQELEDIYRPYRPKRRTRATVAKEKGLEPLAQRILLQEDKTGDPLEIAKEFINPEKEVNTAEEAIEGAKDIIAEIFSDDADYRKKIRSITLGHGVISTKASTDEDSVYSMYYEFAQSIKSIANHRVLAIDRGEKDGFLRVSVALETSLCTDYLLNQVLKASIYNEIITATVEDAYTRLIAPSIEREIRNSLTEKAEEGAMKLFSENLKQLLMQPPVKGKTVLGLDPGYRTGCKLAVVDDTGKVLATGVIYCTLDNHDKEKSAKIVKKLISDYNIDLISIGNGTASGESEKFISEIIHEIDKDVRYIIANEAGASVYSASKMGAEEFPDFTVEQRSATSIARRIQDPLSELVKIDPKSIGVGQYQHDMNQKKLSESLGGVVESCVNNVGVDLNTASWPLLSYIAGISKAVAKNIVKYRDENGKFTSRKELLKVDKLGPKAFVQCAGFLKIPDAKDVLDSTSVHPESYDVARSLLKEAGCTEEDVRLRNTEKLKNNINEMDLQKFLLAHNVGLPTVTDIRDSLLKPDRDPRDDMPKPVLKSEILTMESLTSGMVLTGTVRNVIDFGAFVDIGVHQDGLVHISEISDRYIKHPTEVLKVGDIVKVRVIDINMDKKRISLSMKQV